MDLSQLVSVTDAARELDCSKSLVYKLVASGQIKAYKLGTGKKSNVRIDRSSLPDALKPYK